MTTQYEWALIQQLFSTTTAAGPGPGRTIADAIYSLADAFREINHSLQGIELELSRITTIIENKQ